MPAGSLAACAAIPAAAAWGFDIPQKRLFILLGTLMVAAAVANAALAIRTLACNYERKYPQKTIPRWAGWLTRTAHQDHHPGCPRNAPGHARCPQTTGPTDTTLRTMAALVTALLMAAALMSCTQHQHPTPVDTQEGLEVYLRLSQDGVEWDYMEWRPGVHRYQQYGVADAPTPHARGYPGGPRSLPQALPGVRRHHLGAHSGHRPLPGHRHRPGQVQGPLAHQGQCARRLLPAGPRVNGRDRYVKNTTTEGTRRSRPLSIQRHPQTEHRTG